MSKEISKENKLLALSGICLLLLSTGLLILLQSSNSRTMLETSISIRDFWKFSISPSYSFYSFNLYNPRGFSFGFAALPDTLQYTEHLTIIAPNELKLPDTGTIEVRYQLELRSINDNLSDDELLFMQAMDGYEFPIKVSMASPSITITQPDNLEHITRVNQEEVWFFLVKPVSTGKSTYAISFSGPTVELLNKVRQMPDESSFSYQAQEVGILRNSATPFLSDNISNSSQILRDIEIVDVFGLPNNVLKIINIIGYFFGPIFTLPWILEKINARRKQKQAKDTRSYIAE